MTRHNLYLSSIITSIKFRNNKRYNNQNNIQTQIDTQQNKRNFHLKNSFKKEIKTFKLKMKF